MRVGKLFVLGLLLILLGCSSGGTRSGGTAAPAPGPGGTANLSLRVDVGGLSSQNSGTPSVLIIRVVDATETERDVVDPVTIALTGDNIVQRTITDIPLGLRRVSLAVLDADGLVLGSLLSDPLNISPGPNSPVSLQVQYGPPPPPPPPPGVNQLVFLTQPAGTPVNQALNPAVQVGVLDSNGNLVSTSSDTVTLMLANNPAGATLGGTTTVNAVNGVATFSDLTLDQAGLGYTLSAGATGLTGATSLSFDVATTVGPPAQLAFITQPIDTVAGQFIAPPVQVVVQDAAGITVPTAADPINLSLGANPGATTLNGTTSAVPNNGVATFNDLHIVVPAAGYSLVASTVSLPTTTSNLFVITSPATQLAFGTQPAMGQARAALGSFTVEIQDASGNVVTSSTDTVTIALAANPGPATLSGTLSVAAVNGVATFNNVVLSRSGTGYTLLATAGGLMDATSGPFDQSFPRGYLLQAAGFPVAIASEPVRAGLTSDGNFLYVARFITGPGQVDGFSVNPATGALSPLLSSPYTSLGNQPAAVRTFPDNTHAVVVNAASNSITRFNIVAGDLVAPVNAAVGPNPLDFAIRQGTTTTAYVSNFGNNTISAIDLGTMTTVAGSGTVLSGLGTNQQVELHPNNNLLVLPTGNVFAVNDVDGGIAQVGSSPFASAVGICTVIHPNGNFLYTGGSNQIAVHSINPATGFLTPVAGSPFATAPGGNSVMWMSFNGEFLYATPDNDTVTHIYAIDPVTGAPTEIDDSPVTTGENRGVAVSPFDTFVYMCDRFNNLLNCFTFVP